MSEPIYRKLADILDTLPNGFPSTPDGLEIKCLEMIFTPEEAELCCDLKLSPESAPQIAARTGRPLEGLEEQLTSMTKRGEILGLEMGGAKVFALVPWMPGIWEWQINRMNREFCELTDRYNDYFMPGLAAGPIPMQSVPIGESVTATQQALPFAHIANIIENGKSFRVGECVCKKDRGLLASPCKKPTEVCLTVGASADVGTIFEWGREISKEQAYQVLREAEAAGLVHLTPNVTSGHAFICNCCGCCCAVLRPVNQLNTVGLVNSPFFAVIDSDLCNNCGVCLDERCQVKAVEQIDLTYQVIKGRCIGCGLCVTTCPTEAITLLNKSESEISLPLASPYVLDDARAQARGVDFSAYK